MGGRLLFLSCCVSGGYKEMVQTKEDNWLLYTSFRFIRGGPSCPSRKRPCYPAFLSRMTRALMDSLGPEWRLKLPSIPVVPVSAQKRWNSLPPENHKETAKSKSKDPRSTKSKGKPRLPTQCWAVSL